MKSLSLLLISILFIFSCIKIPECNQPKPIPPYGMPNHMIVLTDSAGEETSVEYMYFCIDGYFWSITYTRNDICSNWSKPKALLSAGMCF